MSGKKKSSILRDAMLMSVVIFLVGAFIVGQIFGPREFEGITDSDCLYKGEITWIDDDGSRHPIEQESRVFDTVGKTLVLEMTIPDDVEDNTFIAFKFRHSSVKVWKDDELIVDRDTSRVKIFGRSNISLYDFIPITREDAGKTLHTESLAAIISSTGKIDRIYQGTEMQIWHDILFETGLETIVAIFTMIVSLILILGVRLINRIFQAEQSLEYLGLCLFIFSANLVLDAGIRQLLFKSVSTASLVSFMLYPLMGWAFVKYGQSLQEGRYGKFYKVMDIGLFATCWIVIILHITQVKTLLENLLTLLMVTFVVMLATIIVLLVDHVQKKDRGHRLVTLGMIIFFVFSSMILIGVEFVDVTIENVLFSFMLIFLVIVACRKALSDVMVVETERKVAAMANETKSMFLATMSHDLRTPINTVMGMNELILRENPAEPINRYSLSIQRASRNLVDLVNDILDFSKMEDGMLEINEGSYNLGIVIADLSNMIKEKAMEKKLELNINVQSTLPKIVNGDEKRVKQIITNILTNAAKFTDRGSITVNITGTISPDNMLLLRVEVADTGQGIRPENLERLFESFVRLEEKTNMSIDGLGLGLTITKKLLVAMEGTIDVKSEFGKGSTFTVQIPQKVIDATEIGAWGVQVKSKSDEPEEYVPMLEAPEAEILAVDDNRMNLTVLKGLLRPTKVKVTLAKSGQECLDLCKDKKFDLIFMDHMMPEMDGIEALHKLNDMWRESGLGCPVVALTANAISGAREMYMKEGFTDYMTKPVEAVELEKTLIRYLPKSKLPENYSGLR